MPAECLFCPSVRRPGGRYDGKVTIVSALPCCGLDHLPLSLLDLKESSTQTAGLKKSRMSALAGVVCCEKDECQAERRRACHSDSFQFYLRIAYWHCLWLPFKANPLSQHHWTNCAWNKKHSSDGGLKKGFWDHVKLQDSLKLNHDTLRVRNLTEIREGFENSTSFPVPVPFCSECDNTMETTDCFQHNLT